MQKSGELVQGWGEVTRAGIQALSCLFICKPSSLFKATSWPQEAAAAPAIVSYSGQKEEGMRSKGARSFSSQKVRIPGLYHSLLGLKSS